MYLKLKNKYKEIILLILIFTSMCFIFKYLYNNYNLNITEKKRIETYLNNNKYDSINKINVNNKEDVDSKYKLLIEIPKIELFKGVYDYKSKYNNVDKNIYLLKESSMPDINNSNLILASHSGNSTTSHFKNLNKLNFDDEIYIYYNGYKYIYKINDIYKHEKSGEIYRNINYNTLTLITCDKTDKTKQLVYIAYLFKHSKY